MGPLIVWAAEGRGGRPLGCLGAAACLSLVVVLFFFLGPVTFMRTLFCNGKEKEKKRKKKAGRKIGRRLTQRSSDLRCIILIDAFIQELDDE